MGCSETSLVTSSLIEETSINIKERGDEFKQIICETNTDLGQSYLEANAREDFTILLRHLDDDSALSDMKPSPKWATAPTTTACAAISLINRTLKVQRNILNQQNLLPYAQPIKDMLLEDNESLVQHLTYFLWKVATARYKEFCDELIKIDIFKAINRFILHKNYSFRFTVVKLCAFLYHENEIAKKLFCESKGIKSLIGQVYFSPLKGLHFCQRLKFLNNLMTQNGQIVEEFAVLVTQEIGSSFFSRVDFDDLSEIDIDAVDKLLANLVYTRKNFILNNGDD